MSFPELLRQCRKQKHMSQAELASLLGVTQQAVGKWESGKSSPDPTTVAKLAEILDTTADYLLGLFDPTAEGQTEERFFGCYVYCLIPVIGTVKAGYGALAYEEDYGKEYARVKDPSSYFYLVVRGDSMEPRIHDGDLALVHRQDTLENGDLGVLIYGDVLPILISENVGMSASLAIATLSIFSALTMVPLSLNCKERNYKPEEEDENFSPRQMFSYLGKNKYLLTYYGGYCATDALKTSAAVTLFVSFYLFGNSLYSIVLNLLNMVPGVFAAMLMPTILKKLDKFKTLFWCNIVNIILGLVIFFVGYENRALFLTLTCVRTIPMSIVGILAFMFTPDCAEYGQYKSGISAKGITFAIQTFSVKITAAVSSSLALALLGCFHWISVEAESFEALKALNIQQSAGALEGLWIVYALVPVIGMIISTFFYLGYKLNDKDVQIMARCNAGEITREEAESMLSRKY